METWTFVIIGTLLCCLHPLLTVGLALALLDAKGLVKFRSPVQLGAGEDEDYERE